MSFNHQQHSKHLYLLDWYMPFTNTNELCSGLERPRTDLDGNKLI